jgi:UDP-glucose 4-epimerase
MKQLTRNYHAKKVLITGGAGFIGSHLAEQCYHYGAYVTILDNFSTGMYENIAHLAPHISCITGDITDFKTCQNATHGMDIIFHLAAYASAAGSCEDPYACMNTNVTGTLNMLEAARCSGAKRFVFASSAAIYGNSEDRCSETTPCKPLSPYGHSKYLGEMLCQQYAQISSLRSVCLRYFNVYGPRQRGDLPHAGVIARITHCMDQYKPFTIYGDGLQRRDFIHVEDIVQANLLFGAYLPEHCRGEAYNIASGDSVPLMTMIERLQTQFPCYPSSHITFAPARSADIKISEADCSKYQTFVRTLTETIR